MVVGLLTVELHVPGAQSLKDKRHVVRRIKDRLKKFNVAVSEVEHQASGSAPPSPSPP